MSDPEEVINEEDAFNEEEETVEDTEETEEVDDAEDEEEVEESDSEEEEEEGEEEEDDDLTEKLSAAQRRQQEEEDRALAQERHKDDRKLTNLTKDLEYDLDFEWANEVMTIDGTEINLPELTSEYPEVAGMIKYGAVAIASQIVKKNLAPIQDKMATDSFFSELEEVYPGARSVSRTPEFTDWLKGQSDSVRKIAETGVVSDAELVLRLYESNNKPKKSALTPPAKKKSNKTRRIVKSKKPKPAKGDYDADDSSTEAAKHWFDSED